MTAIDEIFAERSAAQDEADVARSDNYKRLVMSVELQKPDAERLADLSRELALTPAEVRADIDAAVKLHKTHMELDEAKAISDLAEAARTKAQAGFADEKKRHDDSDHRRLPWPDCEIARLMCDATYECAAVRNLHFNRQADYAAQRVSQIDEQRRRILRANSRLR